MSETLPFLQRVGVACALDRDHRAPAPHLAPPLRATVESAAHPESLRLPNEFYERSKHPLDTPQ